MAGLNPGTCIIFLAFVIRTYAPATSLPVPVPSGPTCSQGIGSIGPNVICTAGTEKNYILKKGLVSDSNRTSEIVLTNCGITQVEAEAFNALPSLQKLDISQNTINVLDELFKETPNLRNLNLSNCNIKEIKPYVFNPLTKLNSLDLSNNVILWTDLRSGTFEHNRYLEYLDLSGNYMIGIQGNILEASVKTMKTLKLNRCRLSDVPSSATRPNLESLTRLELSSNQIIKLDNPKIFASLVNLEFLNLDGNLIDFVHEDVFKDIKNVKAISLQNNKITQLPESLFTNLRKLGNLNLSHNLIKYVPVNAFRYTNLKNLNLADNNFTYLQDNFCLELRNSGVRLRKFFFNQNPWQCACLNDILVEVKKIGIQYNGLKYNGKEPVCVTTTEFQCKRHANFNEEYLEMYNELTNRN